MTEKKITWGGSRMGAGRKTTGKKQRCLWLSDAEYEAVKALVADLREAEEKDKQSAAKVAQKPAKAVKKDSPKKASSKVFYTVTFFSDEYFTESTNGNDEIDESRDILEYYSKDFTFTSLAKAVQFVETSSEDRSLGMIMKYHKGTKEQVILDLQADEILEDYLDDALDEFKEWKKNNK